MRTQLLLIANLRVVTTRVSSDEQTLGLLPIANLRVVTTEIRFHHNGDSCY